MGRHEDYNIFKKILNLGAGNSDWLFLQGRKPLKKHLKVGRKPSLPTSFIYIANLTVISVYKIGFFWVVACYCIVVV